MASKFMRGAFVEFMPTFLIPLPNVIIFQYNPETIAHSWTQAEGMHAAGSSPGANPLAVRGVPGESFSFTIVLDAGDTIADGGPVAGGIASATGVYSRLAALEMLQYPVRSGGGAAGLVGSVSISAAGVSVGGSASAESRSVPQAQVPTVLFIWGPGRILPVRVSSLTINERLYDGLLNPTHAEAQLNLKVLTPEELRFVTGPLAIIARGAYTYSQALRQALALANLAESAESIIGLLPL